MQKLHRVVWWLAAAMALPVLTANAEIEPVTFSLALGQHYTVPSNKVLVVENITVFKDSPTVDNCQILFGLFTWRQDGDTSVSLASPIHMAGGWGPVYVPDVAGSGHWSLSGLLVDFSDLYASVSSEFRSIYATASQVHGRLRLSSPRPAQVKIEGASDLMEPDWTEDVAALVRRTSAAERALTLPKTESGVRFYRAKVRATK